jgi:hypothetical protein
MYNRDGGRDAAPVSKIEEGFLNTETPNTEIANTDTQKAALDAALESGVTFAVIVNAPGILHRLGLKKTRREFHIKPLYLGSLVRISRKLLELEPVKFITDRGELGAMESAMTAMSTNMDGFVYILAAAIHNRESEPPRELQKFLRDNITPRDAARLLGLVLSMLGVSDFLACMASVNALNLSGKNITGAETQTEPTQTSSTSGQRAEA